MEHQIINAWAAKHYIQLDAYKMELLINYAQIIYEKNKFVNITGFKTKKDILTDLILKSIEPVITLHVPRGTSFADIGTGAGIPGIPIAIYCEHISGILFDSNNKKIDFVLKAIQELRLTSIKGCCGRIENFAHGEFRECFDFVFARAMGNIFLVIEMGAPLLKKGGFLYVYSNIIEDKQPEKILHHAATVGLMFYDITGATRILQDGIIFQKKRPTDAMYPRKMSLIKRDIKKL